MLEPPAAAPPLYRGHRSPPGVISYAVWLKLCLGLSLRDVDGLLAERGVSVTDETIGQWRRKSGPVCAEDPRRRGPRPGDKRHLNAVARRING